MRAAFYGNICNNLYQIAKALRLYSDIDAHLYIENLGDPQTLPESDDPYLVNNYPDWIHVGSYLLGTRGRLGLAPGSLPFLRELSGYDLIVVCGSGPILAPVIRKPICFLVMGGDLTMMPFPGRLLSSHSSASLTTKMALMLNAFRQRNGIRRCAQILTQPFAPFVTALRQLHVSENRISTTYFPLVIDTLKFKCDERASLSDLPTIRQVRDQFDFVLFHPSRMMIKADPTAQATGQWKRNDLLLQGFARFLQSNQASRAGLVLIDRDASPDVAQAKEIIASLQIGENVLWLKPPRPFGFTRDELIPLYSLADVVADDFGVGWFGCVVLEACALECPVVSYVDEQVMAQLYPWHPILSTNTVEGIADHLTRLYLDAEFRQQRKRLGRQWIEEFHSPENAGRIYIRNFQKIVGRTGIS